MDFTLSNEQRAWQMTARKFAEEEIRPISLERDEIDDPRETFDWEIVKKGSRLGFRTMAVPKEWGGHGTDFVTQALVMAELAQGRQRDLQDLQPVLEVEPPDRRDLHRRAEGALPQAVPGGRHVPARQGHQRAERRLRQPPAARRRSRPASSCAPSATATSGSSTARNASSPTPPSASCSSSTRAPIRTCRCKQGTTMFLVPRDTPGFRIGKVFNKSGWRFYQNGEMIFENARVPHANVVGEVNGAVRKTGGRGGDTTGGDMFGDLELAANALGVCDDACEHGDDARAHEDAGRPAAVRAAAGAAQAQQDAHAHRGAALVRACASPGSTITRCTRPNAGLCMNYSTDVIQEVTELNLDLHAGGGRERAARRQARARRLHLEPPRRRYRAAHEGRAAIGAVVSTLREFDRPRSRLSSALSVS